VLHGDKYFEEGKENHPVVELPGKMQTNTAGGQGNGFQPKQNGKKQREVLKTFSIHGVTNGIKINVIIYILQEKRLSRN
jgi:ribosomal protein S6E (S10)